MTRVYIKIETVEPRRLDLASEAIFLRSSRSPVRQRGGCGQMESIQLPGRCRPQGQLGKSLMDKANLWRIICSQRGAV
jgi:hypothetical protein